LRNLLRSLRDQGATILISSHILSELEGFCTSIGIMEKGRLLRSGTIAQVTAAENPTRVLRLRWLGDSTAIIATVLGKNGRASRLSLGQQGPEANEGSFHFAGSEEELAPLLAGLIGAGVRMLAFSEVRQTVEDLYMKLSRHEVT
jgi:ABC-2 type transport system ATP-binding protein